MVPVCDRLEWTVYVHAADPYHASLRNRYIFNYLYAISDDDDYVSISTACDLSTSEYGILIGYGFVATFW